MLKNRKIEIRIRKDEDSEQTGGSVNDTIVDPEIVKDLLQEGAKIVMTVMVVHWGLRVAMHLIATKIN